MEVPDELIENLMLDWRKFKIDKQVKAKLLVEYRKKHNISQRELGRRLGVPSSTIQDWLSYAKFNNPEVRQMKKAGFTDTEIYREVRNNKKLSCEGRRKPELDKELSKINYQVNLILKSISKYKHSSDTEYILRKIRDNVNRIMIKLEK